MKAVLAFVAAAMLVAYVDATTSTIVITPTANGFTVTIDGGSPTTCTSLSDVKAAITQNAPSSATSYDVTIKNLDGSTKSTFTKTTTTEVTTSVDTELTSGGSGSGSGGSGSGSDGSGGSSSDGSGSSSDGSSKGSGSGEGGKGGSGGKGNAFGKIKVKCFAADSKVMTDKGEMTMAELYKQNENANILTADGKFSALKSWIHANEEMEVEFNQITTTEGILKATNGHLIYLEGKQAINAGKVQVGDRLLNGEMKSVQVLKIEKVISKGFFAPLTETGDLLVNGHFVSSYSEIEAPMLQSVMFQYIQNVANYLPSRVHQFLVGSETAEAAIGFFELGQKFMA